MQTYVTVEFIIDIQFHFIYSAFDIDEDGVALLFSGQNTIEVYQARTVEFMDFVRRLPLYKYQDKMSFVINKGSQSPVFQRLQHCVYVVLVNLEEPSDKRIFIYDLFKTSHNSLNNIIKLNPDFANSDMYLSTEKLPGFQSVYIYIFYEESVYQFITYEPDNSLVPANITEDQIVSTPGSFQDVIVNYELYPIKTEETQSQNESFPIQINCANIGLVVRQRNQRDQLTFTNDQGTLRLGLLDLLEGFNMSYSLRNYEEDASTNRALSYRFSKDIKYEYLLEAVNNFQSILYSFQYMIDGQPHLVLLYRKDYLMQLFSLEGGITRIQPDFNYSSYFEGCKIDFAHHTFIRDTDSSFIILNCEHTGGWIGPKYDIKIFSFNLRKVGEYYKFDIYKLTEIIYDNKIIRADFIISPLKKLDYLLAFQPDYGILGESTIILIDLK